MVLNTVSTEDKPEAASDTWLSPEDIAKKIHVHSSTIRRLINNGELEATKVGEQWRIRQSAWESYLETHTKHNRKHEGQSE
jgi:excisionase family DNA binding protein